MFTNDWFQITAKDNFEKYLPSFDLVTEDYKLNFLEIGCYEGRASVWLMENTKAKLTVIDTFKGSKEHDAQFESTLIDRFIDNTKKYEERIIIMEGASQDLLKGQSKNSYDFIYVDGSHQASDVLEDAVLAFPLLMDNGIMIFDDYTWGAGMNPHDIPATGINAFLDVYRNKIEILEINSQVIIRKLFKV